MNTLSLSLFRLHNGMIHQGSLPYMMVGASAFLLLCAYSCAALSFCSLLFLLPIFYGALLNHRFSWAHGFVWGSIFFAVHLRASLYCIAMHNTALQGLLFVCCIIGYCAAHTGLWIAISSYVCKLHKGSLVWAACAWSLVTTLFFWLFYRYGLWIAGDGHGYFGALFWLPLMRREALLPVVAYCGFFLSTAIVIVCQALGAYYLTYAQGRYWIMASITLMYVYTAVARHTRIEQAPGWLAYCCWIAEDFSRHHEHPHDRAHRIASVLASAVAQHPQAQLFLLPESACPYAVNHEEHLLAWWFDILHPDSLVLFGGHHKCTHKTHNTIFVAHNASIIFFYDKTSLVPGAEYIPPLWISFNQRLKNIISSSFTPAPSANSLWCLPPSLGMPAITIKPIICSELFLDTNLKTSPPGTVHVCLVNDSWFATDPGMQELMFLYAKAHAVLENRAYLYISHTRGIYISPTGREIPLPSCTRNSF